MNGRSVLEAMVADANGDGRSSAKADKLNIFIERLL